MDRKTNFSGPGAKKGKVGSVGRAWELENNGVGRVVIYDILFAQDNCFIRHACIWQGIRRFINLEDMLKLPNPRNASLWLAYANLLHVKISNEMCSCLNSSKCTS